MSLPALEARPASVPAPVPADPPSRLDWRWALPRLAAVFVVTRLLVLLVAVAAEASQPLPADVVHADDRPILSSLTLWDGEYYLGVAADGYHADPAYGPDYAFYPGYPATIRAVSLLTGGDAGIASVLVSNAAFFGALMALFALSVTQVSAERAVRSLWFLALAPGAIAFTLSYSESLFLLLGVLAFLGAEKRHPWLAGGALMLATLTRVPGILLVAPLALVLAEQYGWHSRRVWLPLLLAPAAICLWVAWLWWLTGDPGAIKTAQSYWDVAQPAGLAGGGSGGVVRSHVAGFAPSAVIALWLGILLFHVFLLVFFRHDRIRPAYVLTALLAIATVFLAGRLLSSPRFLAVGWPFDWVLASRHSRSARYLVLAMFTALQVLVLWWAFTAQVPP